MLLNFSGFARSGVYINLIGLLIKSIYTVYFGMLCKVYRTTKLNITLKKILWGHGHTKFGRRIRSLHQFVVQQLPNEKVSEPYERSVNFSIIIT